MKKRPAFFSGSNRQIEKVAAVWHGLDRYRRFYWIFWLLFFFGTSSFAVHFIRHTEPGAFYQNEFAPAVMQACGRGFYDVKPQPGAEKLRAFLRTERVDMACSDLPSYITVSEPNAFPKTHRYLFAAVAAIWAMFGVSWGAVIYLNAALFALTLILCYLLNRLVLGPFIAWIPVGLFAMSHLHLEQLPHLRDYVKAPFMLGMIWLTVLLIVNRAPVGRLRLAALLGLLAGMGIGFRMDILLLLPFVLASVLLFSDISWSLLGLGRRIGILGVFGLAFFAVGAPILLQLGQGSNTLHVILLGLAPEFDYGLGLPATAHDLLERYNDTFLNALLSLWNDPGGVPLQLTTRDYEAAGQQYLLQLIGIFPADFLLRTLSASFAIMSHGLPAMLRELIPQGWLHSPLIALPFLLCFARACTRSKRVGLFLLFATAYLFSSTALQFASRHWFYLQAASFAFLVFACSSTLKSFLVLWRHKLVFARNWPLKAADIQRLLPAAVAALGVVIGLYGLFFLLRDYQVRHGYEILDEYRRLPMAGDRLIKKDDSVGVNYHYDLKPGTRFGAGDSAQVPGFSAAYMVAKFDPARCGRKDVNFRIGYQASAPYLDFSRMVSLNLVGETKYYFPVFNFFNVIHEGAYLRFDGISISNASSACLVNIDRIDLVPHKLPLLNLSIDASTVLAPRAFAWQLPESSPPSYCSNIDRYSDIYFEGRKSGLGRGGVEIGDPVFHVLNDQSWQLLGYPQGANVNIASFNVDDSGQGFRVFLLAGKIKRGALAMGLLENNKWVWSMPIARQGEFRVALRVARGQQPVLSAYGRDQNIFLDVDLTYADWVDEIKY